MLAKVMVTGYARINKCDESRQMISTKSRPRRVKVEKGTRFEPVTRAHWRRIKNTIVGESWPGRG